MQAQRGKAMWGHSEPRGEDSEKTKPASTLILDFKSPEMPENKYLLKHPVCGILLYYP